MILADVRESNVTNQSSNSRQSVWLDRASVLLLAAFMAGAPLVARADIPPATSNAAGVAKPSQPDARSDPRLTKLLNEANAALKKGQVDLALIQLKNAVQLAPKNGAVRAQLGLTLIQSGDAVTGERELRQARTDNGPSEVIVPALIQAMLMRGETKDLLDEFKDTPQTMLDKTAPDVLRGRAIALQMLGQTKDSAAAMDRALVLRRDVPGLLTRAQLARQQNDLPTANAMADEAIRQAPKNADAILLKIGLIRQGGDLPKALTTTDDLIKLYPANVAPKIARIEILLEQKQDALAKQDVAALLTQFPKLTIGSYYHAVIAARAKDYKGAWAEAQTLPPEFVQSQPQIGMMVAQMAIDSGNLESGGAILATTVAKNPTLIQARLQLGSLRLRQNSADAALEALTPLKNSDDPQTQALLAQVYLRLQRYTDAIASLQKATASGQGTELLKRQLALSELQAGQSDKAIQDLREIANKDPTNPDTVAPLIAALARAGKFDDALAVADRVAKGQPKSPLPAFYRGQIYVLQGNLAKASEAFAQALALDPKFIPAYYYRANIAAARGDGAQATSDLKQIIALDPKNVLALVKLADLAANNDDEAQAMAMLNQAIKAAPDNPMPRLALANYQIFRGKYTDAQATVTALLQVSHDNPEAQVLQGQIQMATGAKKLAADTYRTLTAKQPLSAGAELMLAGALNANGDKFGTETAIRKAIDLTPQATQPRGALIKFQIDAGKFDDAVATARNYAAKYPGTDGDLLVADTLNTLKRYDEATAILTKSLATKPDNRIVLRLSQIAVTTGDATKALKVLSDWLVKNPNDTGVRQQYGSLLLITGNAPSARKEFETVLKTAPDDAVSLNNLGWIIQKEDPARAMAMVSHAVAIAPRTAEIVDTLGWMKIQGPDHPGGLKLLQRAHDLDKENPQIGYHLAVALDQSGKRADAKALLQSVLARNPRFEGVEDAKQLVARW